MDHSRNNPWRFNNHSTIMQVLFIPPSDTLFSNIDHTHTVSNGKGESVVFDKGYYTLPHIIAMLSQVQYISSQYPMLLPVMIVFILIPVVQLISHKHQISSIFWVYRNSI